MMMLDLHRQGLSVTAIARRTGRDPKTIRKYIECGLELPTYGPRQVGRPNKLAPYLDYLRERVAALGWPLSFSFEPTSRAQSSLFLRLSAGLLFFHAPTTGVRALRSESVHAALPMS